MFYHQLSSFWCWGLTGKLYCMRRGLMCITAWLGKCLLIFTSASKEKVFLCPPADLETQKRRTDPIVEWDIWLRGYQRMPLYFHSVREYPCMP